MAIEAGISLRVDQKRFDRIVSEHGLPERNKAVDALRNVAATALRRLAGWCEDSGTPIEIREDLEKVKHILATVDDLGSMKSLRKD